LDANTILQHSPEAVYQTVGEEAVLINLNTGAYYSLNDTGTVFWELLDGRRTVAECARRIAADYEVEAEVVEADLLELATDLQNEGLIVG
jgi:hypothetical protein